MPNNAIFEAKQGLGIVVHELFQCVGREVFLILREQCHLPATAVRLINGFLRNLTPQPWFPGSTDHGGAYGGSGKIWKNLPRVLWMSQNL